MLYNMQQSSRLPLAALAFAALEDDDLKANHAHIEDMFLPMMERTLPGCTCISEWLADERLPTYELMSGVHNAMMQWVRLEVCEPFLAAGVHKTLKKLRNNNIWSEDQSISNENDYIKAQIRSMPIFNTLGGRNLLKKMADPSYYAKLTRADTYGTEYCFLRTKSHMAHMRVLAELATTSFDYMYWDEVFTVSYTDIERHLDILRLDIAPSNKRQRWF
jgi:hypothetical protein